MTIIEVIEDIRSANQPYCRIAELDDMQIDGTRLLSESLILTADQITSEDWNTYLRG